jgi:preprotein translocase subunit SecG
MEWAKLLVPFFNVVYVVIAILMSGLILVQRGAGAQAGSGFGAGASGTVFGAQGSANFLSRATSFCATIFFLISLGMGIYIAHGGRPTPGPQQSQIMSDFQDAAPAAKPELEIPSDVPTVTPSAAANATPAAPAAATPAPATPAVTVPNAESAPVEVAPAPTVPPAN